MKTADILALARDHLQGLENHVFDVLEVAKPISPEAAVNLAKIVSKLSPLVGNLIEFNVIEYLNDQPVFDGLGTWCRQDPGFPDNIFRCDTIAPQAGLEVKAWFPLATEITARFKGSQSQLAEENTHVALLAWLPEFLIYGKPKIIDVKTIDGLSVAKARDKHYHKPPGYLVVEPHDTTGRTINLQQTNTTGYKFQGTAANLAEAKEIVDAWGKDGRVYQTTEEYQIKLRSLMTQFPYREDTNFAKLDRIAHVEIEAFKVKVEATNFHGKTIGQWRRLLASRKPEKIKKELASEPFKIADVDASIIVE